ncbi:acyltransferase LovD [Diplogelasinospora grovesii]|uniref:Acyltransferase LovD n=1 Tax=Diplogelasinospora grovesii TaxID=303347 RepID=A0AAN6NIJ1_9PEZI|nr:acyltransferase LovD [Diplogelasinospora grovesii]
MSSFDAQIEKAIQDGIIPGVVLLAKDKSGKLSYSKALGHASLNPQSPQPMTTNTVFTLASMTKLLTTVSVLQLVDRGLISLESDVCPHLPALAKQPILTGFSSSGEPITKPRTKPILLRHLLTHSSGLGYGFLDPLLARYAELKTGVPPRVGAPGPTTVESRFDLPLLFEPGEGWTYGCGLDWCGLLLRTLTGQNLEEYLATHVFPAVGVTPGRITFFPEQHRQTLQDMAMMTSRNEQTGRVEHAPLPTPEGDRDCFGGEAAVADLSEYLKVMESLLNDDGKLLTPQTAARYMFTGQLKEQAAKQALLDGVKNNPGWIVGWVPDTGEYDFSCGGLLVTGDKLLATGGGQGRHKGFLMWSGVFNLNWWIDREAGICGIFGTQVLQPADPLIRPLMKAFEEEIFARAAKL